MSVLDTFSVFLFKTKVCSGPKPALRASAGWRSGAAAAAAPALEPGNPWSAAGATSEAIGGMDRATASGAHRGSAATQSATPGAGDDRPQSEEEVAKAKEAWAESAISGCFGIFQCI